MDQSTEIESEGPKRGKRCWFARLLRQEQPPRAQTRFGEIAQAALDGDAVVSATTSAHGTLYRAGVTLAALRPGECGTVRRLFGPAQGRLRLLEMGLTPGTHIRVVRIAAFGGPLDIVVRGYQLSLRRDEAAGVWLDDPDEDAGELPDGATSRQNATEPRDLEAV
jgi:ferrous iron transport protein A